MDDFKLVEEFLSKKNLDGVDKFLLDKYMGAIRNVLDNSVPKAKIRDKIDTFKSLSAEISGYNYECIPKDLKRNDYAVKMLEELLEEE